MRVRGALALDPEDDVAAKLDAFAAERAKHTTPYFQTPAVKFFVDGVIEGHTGYLKEPYADAVEYAGDPDYRGEPLWEPDALAAAFTAADEAGFQIHVHSIGDAATSEMLDALEVAAGRERHPRLASRRHSHPARQPRGLRPLRRPRRRRPSHSRTGS